MEHSNWRVLESNKGVVSLVVLKNKEVLFQRSGYEKCPMELLMDINELKRGKRGIPVSTWGNNEKGKKENPNGVVVYDAMDCYVDRMRENARAIFGA